MRRENTKRNKRGDNIITPQLVVIIVLIASFGVLLFFLTRLNLGGETNKQICHNSIVLKATTKGTIGSLNCKTDYVCISNGGTCSDITPTQTLKITGSVIGTGLMTIPDGSPVANEEDKIKKNQTFKIIADLMAGCWWMFGEGQLDYYDVSFSTGCAICSVVKFDDKLQNDFPSGFSYKELFEYLRDTKMANSEQNYLSYLFGENSVDALLNSPDLKKVLPIISLKEKYVIRTGQQNAGITGEGILGIFVKAWLGKPGIYHLFPYFIDINHMPENPKCNTFVTKS